MSPDRTSSPVEIGRVLIAELPQTEIHGNAPCFGSVIPHVDPSRHTGKKKR